MNTRHNGDAVDPHTHLKDLHVPHGLLRSSHLVDSTPLLYDAFNVGNWQPRERKIVPRMKANDIASSRYWLRHQQMVRGRGRSRARWGKDRSVIVLEDHRICVGLVLLAACTRVSWAEVAIGIVRREQGRLRRFCLALPWPLCTMRRDEDVFVRQRIY